MAFENAEIKIQQLVEENNKTKSNQIFEQKEEIQRLRSELKFATQKNEEKLANFAILGTNNQLISNTQRYSGSPMPSVSATSSEATTVIPANIKDQAIVKSPNRNEFKFGKHPSSIEKQYIDIHEHISMLQKEKAMFLKTKVYSEDDPIVKQLDDKIEGLLKLRQQ